MGLNNFFEDIVIHQNFLTSEEVQELYSYAMEKYNNKQAKAEAWFTEKYKSQLKVEGHTRYLYLFKKNDTFEANKTVFNAFQKIRQTMELDKFTSYHLDEMIGCCIHYTLPGGFIQPHTDDYKSKRATRKGLYTETARHVRFNLMVERDEDITYNPHFTHEDYKAKPKIVNVGDAWCFPPDRITHLLPTLKGNKPRIVYQFGFAIEI